MRRILLLAAVVLVALAAAVLVLRSSLARADLREAVEARLSAMLGEPVSIGQLGVSLFPRPAVTGGQVRVGEADIEAPSVRIERVRVVPRLGSLLSGDVVVEQVQLEGFVVSVLRDGDGWRVPMAVPAPTADEGGGVVIARVRVADGRVRIFDRTQDGIRERASIDDIHAAVVTAEGGLRLSPISGRIGGAPISGEARIDSMEARLALTAGRITDEDLPAWLGLLGSERPDLLRLTEPGSLSATLRVDRSSSRLSGTGTLHAPGVLIGPLRLQKFEAPFVIDGSRLEFAPATFALYGGAHEGTVGVGLATRPPQWTLDSRVAGMDVGAFLTALNGRDQRLVGTGSLTSALRGRVGESLTQTVHGRARFDVAGGVIRDFPLLAYVGRTLRLAEQEGRDTRFERLSGTLAIASGVATTEDLVLEASHLRVEAGGEIGADRSLALRGIVAVSPERSSAAIASIHELKGLRNARGEVEIPLSITGTLDAPSFSLDVESAIKKGIADELRRRLRRIIR